MIPMTLRHWIHQTDEMPNACQHKDTSTLPSVCVQLLTASVSCSITVSRNHTFFQQSADCITHHYTHTSCCSHFFVFFTGFNHMTCIIIITNCTSTLDLGLHLQQLLEAIFSFTQLFLCYSRPTPVIVSCILICYNKFGLLKKSQPRVATTDFSPHHN